MAASLIDMDYDFVDEVQEIYKCPICFIAPMNNPSHVPECGHVFCKSCIDDWISMSPGSRCPVDNLHIDRNKIFPDHRIQREISNLKVKCKNQNAGCDKITEFTYITDHMQKCEFKPILCPLGCGKAIPKQWIETHRNNECIQRRVYCDICERWMVMGTSGHHCPMAATCEHCNKGPMTRKKLTDEHSKVCEKTPLTCVFAPFGCGEKLLRKDMRDHEKSAMVPHLALLSNASTQLYNKVGFSPAEIFANSGDSAGDGRRNQLNQGMSMRERFVELESTTNARFESLFLNFSQLTDYNLNERMKLIEKENKELRIALKEIKEKRTEQISNVALSIVEIEQKAAIKIDKINCTLDEEKTFYRTEISNLTKNATEMQQKITTLLCQQNDMHKKWVIMKELNTVYQKNQKQNEHKIDQMMLQIDKMQKENAEQDIKYEKLHELFIDEQSYSDENMMKLKEEIHSMTKSVCSVEEKAEDVKEEMNRINEEDTKLLHAKFTSTKTMTLQSTPAELPKNATPNQQDDTKIDAKTSEEDNNAGNTNNKTLFDITEFKKHTEETLTTLQYEVENTKFAISTLIDHSSAVSSSLQSELDLFEGMWKKKEQERDEVFNTVSENTEMEEIKQVVKEQAQIQVDLINDKESSQKFKEYTILLCTLLRMEISKLQAAVNEMMDDQKKDLLIHLQNDQRNDKNIIAYIQPDRKCHSGQPEEGSSHEKDTGILKWKGTYEVDGYRYGVQNNDNQKPDPSKIDKADVDLKQAEKDKHTENKGSHHNQFNKQLQGKKPMKRDNFNGNNYREGFVPKKHSHTAGNKAGQTSSTEPKCKNCALQHYTKTTICPAKGKVCNHCGETGHFRQCCPKHQYHMYVL